MTLILLSLAGLVVALIVALGVLSFRDHRRRRAVGTRTPASTRRGSAALRLTSSGHDLGAVAPGRYLDDSA